ncbi:MAG: hypothetical protein H0U10_06385 [Chloroflexia bacterium]|nr:hypothetical protein [Chloroflexia bacterium]
MLTMIRRKAAIGGVVAALAVPIFAGGSPLAQTTTPPPAGAGTPVSRETGAMDMASPVAGDASSGGERTVILTPPTPAPLSPSVAGGAAGPGMMAGMGVMGGMPGPMAGMGMMGGGAMPGPVGGAMPGATAAPAPSPVPAPGQ